MTPKELFIEKLKARLLAWVDSIHTFCESLPKDYSTQNTCRQLIRSSASTAANHCAACRARSSKEFFAKLSITVEEADESEFWLALIEKRKTKCKQEQLDYLLKETLELVKILSKARGTAGV